MHYQDVRLVVLSQCTVDQQKHRFTDNIQSDFSGRYKHIADTTNVYIFCLFMQFCGCLLTCAEHRAYIHDYISYRYLIDF